MEDGRRWSARPVSRRRRDDTPPEGGWVAEVSPDSPWACVHCGRKAVHLNDGTWWHLDGEWQWLGCRQEDLDAQSRPPWWQRLGRRKAEQH